MDKGTGSIAEISGDEYRKMMRILGDPSESGPVPEGVSARERKRQDARSKERLMEKKKKRKAQRRARKANRG